MALEKIASEAEVRAFVKGAMDRFAERGVSEERALRILDAHLQKKADELFSVRRQAVDGFKKKACAMIRSVQR